VVEVEELLAEVMSILFIWSERMTEGPRVQLVQDHSISISQYQ